MTRLLLACVMFFPGLGAASGKDKADTLRDERIAKARALEKEANELERKGDFQAARQAHTEVVDLYSKAFDQKHFAVNNARLALAHTKLLARLSGEKRQQVELAARLYQQGLSLHAARKYVAAENAHRQALAIRAQLLGEEHRDTAASYLEVGNALFHQGQYEQAEKSERKALDIRVKILGDHDPYTAVSYQHLSYILSAQFKFTEAELLHRKAMDIQRKMLTEAFEKYNNNLALAILREAEFDFHKTLADSYRARGMYAQAELEMRKAWPILPENHGDTLVVAMNLGNILLDQGNYQEAYRCYEQALVIIRSNPKKGIFGQALGEEFVEHHPSYRKAQVFNNLAVAKQLMKEYADASAFLNQAVQELQSIATADPNLANARDSLLFNFHVNQAKLLDDSGQAEAAWKIYKKLLAELEPGKDKHKYVWVRNFYQGLGQNLYSLGDFQTAEPILELQLISLKLNRPLDVNARKLRFVLARNSLSQGNYEKAEETALTAAKDFEAVRAQVSFSGLERSMFAADNSPLSLLAAISARNGKPVDAWKYFEKDRGRGLLDDLSARNSRPLTAAELREQETLQGRLALTEKRLLQEKSSQSADKLRKERTAMVLQIIEFEARMAQAHGPAAGQVYALQTIQTQLPSDAAVIGWLDIDGHTKAKDPGGEHWGVVVRNKGEPVWVKLPALREGQWGAKDNLLPRNAMSVLLNPETEPGRPLQALFRQRLAPLQKHLDGVKHLVVLPSPVMASVPIEALTDQYRISYAPSATIFAWLREKGGKLPSATKEVLALGDPAFSADQGKKAPELKENAMTRLLRAGRPKPLPGTRAEVLAIDRLFAAHKTPVTKFLGREANGQNLDQLAKKKDLTRFRYLHLATHGHADDHGGMNSYLALTPEDFAVSTHAKLSAGQIMRTWNLNADLVTLSACQTALGEHRGGEGYVGFAQALIFAGAQSLILSQWPVHDYSTTLLMYRFYENLLGSEKKQAMAKGDALAEAKNWVKKLEVKDVVSELKALGVPLDGAWVKNQPEHRSSTPITGPPSSWSATQAWRGIERLASKQKTGWVDALPAPRPAMQYLTFTNCLGVPAHGDDGNFANGCAPEPGG